MITNLHTHTVRCRHAWDTEEEYIAVAREKGIRRLGFSDHTPYWFGCDYYSRFRMYPEQLADYTDTVLVLREKYRDTVDIRLGLEAEYYPAYFSELMAHLKDTPVEYLLLGQHFVQNEVGDHYSGRATADEAHLRQYCKQVADGLYTGLFTYLAHPDLIHFTGDAKVYRHYMRTVCKAANDCGIPVELNFLGIREGRHYPSDLFWELAGEENCKVVFGCDAHRAEELNFEAQESVARQMAQQYGLCVLEEPVIRGI